MTRKRTFAAALATTSSVALLATVAQAQTNSTTMGAGEARTGAAICSSTVMSPVFQNCVMPVPNANVAGQGSFPGSFLVPGTSTSFAIHGIVWFQAVHEFGPNSIEGGLLNTTALQGPGVSQTALGAHALNGGTDMTVQPTRPNIETRTPTAYGELKTYIEMDFSLGTSGTSTVYGGAGGPYIPSSSSSQVAGNQDILRLRQAYGTLGPWLFGQTKTLVDDVQVYPDLADAGLDAGMRTSTNVHKPQIRYTYLAGHGISIIADVEQPTHDTQGVYTANGGAAVAWTEDNNGLIPGASIISIPDVGVATQWDQPWGHVRWAGMYHDAKVDNIGNSSTASSQTSSPNTQSNPFTPGQTGFREESPGYYLDLSGHLNTFGRDRLAGIVAYGKGFSVAGGPFVPYDYVLGPGGLKKAISYWSFDASYEHFFTGQWRANVSAGYQKFTNGGLPNGNTTFEVSMPIWAFSAHANVIFSPVPMTDFVTEYEHGGYHTYAGDATREDRVTEQMKFYF